jgi:hypothetical protein
MRTVLIDAKLRAPNLRPAIVPRPRLVERLETSDAPLGLVVAPPGFGKTTLLVQWQSSSAVPSPGCRSMRMTMIRSFSGLAWSRRSHAWFRTSRARWRLPSAHWAAWLPMRWWRTRRFRNDLTRGQRPWMSFSSLGSSLHPASGRPPRKERRAVVSTNRRKFTAEFKAYAVQLVIQPIAQSVDLGSIRERSPGFLPVHVYPTFIPSETGRVAPR